MAVKMEGTWDLDCGWVFARSGIGVVVEDVNCVVSERRHPVWRRGAANALRAVDMLVNHVIEGMNEVYLPWRTPKSLIIMIATDNCCR